MTHLEIINSKLHTKESIQPLLNIWRFKNEKIVFSNGCFDIVHKGHVDYLAQAADLGKHLIIGLNSDKSIKNLKGKKRPFQDEKSRIAMLAALHFVSAVIIFNEPTPYNLIKAIQPDYLVKGNDYKAEDVVGNDIVTTKGGKVKTIELTSGYSTTLIVEKIIRQQ